MAKARKALVLGGKTGLLGGALMDALKEGGWEAVAVGGTSSLDLSRPDASDGLASLMDAHEPDVVFNTVAYTRVDDAEDNPTAASLLNRNLPGILGRLAKERGCGLVHYSTDFVFDGRGDRPYRTEDAPSPQSVYGKSKREGEEALLGLGLANLLVIRTAWLFGPGKRNFVSAILDKCREGEALNIVDDQVGSPTYTVDLAAYTLRLLDAGGLGLFHVVNSGQASWFDLAVEAVGLSGLKCTVNAVPSSAWPQKARRPAYSVLDTGRAASITGVTPRPWMQALREYIFREFPPED